MCSLVMLRRPGHDWPLLLAANRDELRARASRPPARHWPDRPDVVAGLDIDAGGSWLGVNDHGLTAAVLNREGTLGPQTDKRSRGELVLEALDHAESRNAAGALADLHPSAYRPFNLILADPRNAYWLRHGGDGEIRVHPIPAGLHMIDSADLDDLGQSRIARFLPLFRAAPAPERAPRPDPLQATESGGWAEWIRLLQRRDWDPAGGPASAMNLDGIKVAGLDFGTVASSLIALPACPGFHQRPIFLHADGPPDKAPFLSVDLEGADLS